MTRPTQIRNALILGPGTAEEIAAAVGIPVARVRLALKVMLSHGHVVPSEVVRNPSGVPGPPQKRYSLTMAGRAYQRARYREAA